MKGLLSGWAAALGLTALLAGSRVLAQTPELPQSRFPQAPPALPAAGTYPMLTGEIEIELQHDRITRAPSGAKRYNNTYTDTEANLGLFLGPELSVQSTLHLEPVKDPSGSGVFKSEGLYLEQLFVDYDAGPFTVFAGKLNPRFGTAWDLAPGVYGTDFAEDYEFTEGIGLGASAKLETLSYGTHELGMALFFFDNTFLSNAAFTRPRFGDPFTARPGRLRHQDGGPGNTRAPESFTVTLDGDTIASLPNFAYHLGYARFAKGETEARDQTAFVAGARYKIDLGEGLSLTPMGEYARFWDAGGQPGTVSYTTLAGELAWRQWSASGVVTWRDNDLPLDEDGGGGRFTDRLITFSVGYQLDLGLGVAVGWKRERIERQETDSFGVLLTYAWSFTL